ncbi:MAG TPA: hypothetical protein PLH07_04045 [Sulfurovum sp.]|nr:MAG: hypothetical protein B7Y63_08710 [Sulfurovum sp. 35-42-20]OYZ25790.1 MAG: hypothetical protein B7Y23_03825 [Sulfurovum sp. 16-42-52]OYZ47822.1 MAG: hypothetical protein B7Y13_09325 [Sulfurovum sp. 24-42-9]OZA43452.1 MAG: hypothetical protein B7X80_09255 [Sulfurovum sp. 17-42-90]HQS72247.1 hypothetical protein [Sulfurovum sp.]
MTQLSKIAALACCAVVTIGMTGCGNSDRTTTNPITQIPPQGTPPQDTPVDTCVPEAVKAPATLDQNNTKAALSAALVSEDIAYLLSDGGYNMGPGEAKASEKEPKKVSKLASMLSGKIQTLQQNTATVKKTLISGDGSLEYGDNIACDLGGTYSLQQEDSYTYGENNGIDISSNMNKVTLSFDECVMDNMVGSEALNFFEEMIMYNSIINRLNYYEASSSTTTFNGSLSLEYNSDYTYAYNEWNDNPVQRDDGSNDQYLGSGTSHVVTEGLSAEYKEDNATLWHFASTEELSVTFDYSYTNENNNSYDTPTNEGNYTSNNQYSGQYSTNATFEGSETLQEFYDVNTTTAFSACNVTVENTSTSKGVYSYVSENWYTTVSYDGKYESEGSTKLGGYLVLQDSEGGLDLYADGLTIGYTYDGHETYNYQTYVSTNSNAESLSLSGTVGSTLMGGSAVLSTPSPWLMSSAYPENRGSMLPEEIGYNYFYPYVDYSPYAGKTVLTGTNTATVEFLKDAEDITYGTITIEGEEPVEYDSIEDMGIAYIY